MKLQSHATTIPGCRVVELPSSANRRGSFVKLFQAADFSDSDMPFSVREVFVTSSRQDVLRGLHFQLPPRDVTKLVVCLTGRILDVVVDLRTDSETFGRHELVELGDHERTGMLVPHGCAHGFLVLSPEALTAYVTDEDYDAELDAGIHWASAGIDWPTTKPVLSDRDAAFVDLEDFHSPFELAP